MAFFKDTYIGLQTDKALNEQQIKRIDIIEGGNSDPH